MKVILAGVVSITNEEHEQNLEKSGVSKAEWEAMVSEEEAVESEGGW